MNAPFILLVLLGGGPGQVPGNPPIDTKAEAEGAGSGATKLVGQFAVALATSPERKLKLEPEPVFRWTNTLERRFYGVSYVWTYQGRPEVLAAVNNVFQPGRTARETEFHSLSTRRVVLSYDQRMIWEPAEAGVEWKPLPGAPKAGATAAARLQQMRTLAAQFSVVADYGGKKEMKEDLRLLGSPIFRYQSAEQDVVDGGLFAFTRGTDPETLLLIEARGKKDRAEWQFAFARLNGFCSIRAGLKDKEVWQVDRPPFKALYDPKQSYFCFRK